MSTYFPLTQPALKSGLSVALTVARNWEIFVRPRATGATEEEVEASRAAILTADERVTVYAYGEDGSATLPQPLTTGRSGRIGEGEHFGWVKDSGLPVDIWGRPKGSSGDWQVVPEGDRAGGVVPENVALLDEGGKLEAGQIPSSVVVATQILAGALGAAHTLVLPSNSVQMTGTLTADCTLTVEGAKAGGSAVLLLAQDGTGGRGLTISDGETSQPVVVPAAPGTEFEVTLYSPDGETLYVQTGAETVPSTPWDTTSIVTTFNPTTAAAASALTANGGRGGRVRIPRTATLHDLAIQVGNSSGNVSVSVFDVGAAAAGKRTRLWTTGAIACPAAGPLTVVGDPALPVTEGEYLELWLSVDNATATFVRAAVGAIAFPSSYPAPPGGLEKANQLAPLASAVHPLPATLAGTLGAGGMLPLITGRLA